MEDVPPKELMDEIILSVEEFDLGIPKRAIARLESLVDHYPNRIEPRIILAQHLTERAEFDQARDLMLECVKLSDNIEVLKFASQVLLNAKDYESCVENLLRHLKDESGDMIYYSMLAEAYFQAGKYSHAVAVFRHLEKVHQISAGEMVKYGLSLFYSGSGFDVSMDYLLEAIKISPDCCDAGIKIGMLLAYCGEGNSAARCYRSFALKELRGNISGFSTFYSNYLMMLNYQDHDREEYIYSEHVRYSDYIMEEHITLEPRENSIEKRIRIGFLSGDFFTHPVSFFLMPLLEDFDRSKFEVNAYSTLPTQNYDKTTERLKNLVEFWHDIQDLSELKLVDRIRKDEIDILIDLSGHTGRNRMLVFARRAAPCQVTWLGYPNTSGLKNMDFRIVDSITDPEPEANQYASEKLIRIEGCFICYGQCGFEGKELYSPSLLEDRVVFSSYNNLLKLSGKTLHAWGRILQEVPNSILRLKYFYLHEPDLRKHLKSKFSKFGIDIDRFEFFGNFPDYAEHMRSYNDVDISLDPFPYNGTTSTCDALVMGVPVVALMGERHASRVSASILSAIGFEELIADNVDEYVNLAVGLASDRDALLVKRGKVREAMLASQLMDPAGFARRFEKCLMDIWSRKRGIVG
jgi:protein O-GlcNAc transferase